MKLLILIALALQFTAVEQAQAAHQTLEGWGEKECRTFLTDRAKRKFMLSDRSNNDYMLRVGLEDDARRMEDPCAEVKDAYRENAQAEVDYQNSQADQEEAREARREMDEAKELVHPPISN